MEKDEQFLWEQFQEGSENALSTIFRTYHSDLYNYGLKLTGNDEIVKDSIQEMFLKLWRRKENLSSTTKIKPYLLKSLRHHIASYFNIYTRYKFTDKPLKSFEIEISAEDFIIDSQISEDKRKKVLDVLHQLSGRQREVIFLRYFEDLDFEHIAQIMDINTQSVRNTLHRALQTLREIMSVSQFLVCFGIYLRVQ